MIEIQPIGTVLKPLLSLKISGVQDTQEFNAIIAAIKSCPAGYSWKQATKTWEVPLCLENLRALHNLPEIKEKIREIGEHLIPTLAFKPVMENETFFSVTEPLPHQKEFVPFLIQYPGRGYLVLGGLGTGKTAIMAYLIANKYKDKRILVVAPNKVKPVWPRELEKHAGITGFNMSKPGWTKTRRTRLIEESARYIVNYESLAPDVEALIAARFEVVIADESHRLKNNKAICTKSFNRIIEHAENVYCLTGTPRSNSDLDLFTQCAAVNPWLFGTEFYSFRSRWFEQRGGFNMNIALKMPTRRGETTKKINTGKWLLKKSKESDFQNWLKWISVYFPEDCVKLPPLTFTERYADIPPRVAEKYREIREEMILELREGKIKSLATALQRDCKLLQICSGVVYGPDREIVFQDTFKADLLIDIVENEMDGAAAIVWFNYRHTQAMVEEVCKMAGIRFVSVHGDMKGVAEKIETFENDRAIQLLLASNVIAEGQTILKPKYTIKFDHNFMWLPEAQRTKRNHRQGQTKPVFVIDLISPGTIEEKAFLALREKEDRCREILNGLTLKDL